jgi:hypothetical protein
MATISGLCDVWPRGDAKRGFYSGWHLSCQHADPLTGDPAAVDPCKEYAPHEAWIQDMHPNLANVQHGSCCVADETHVALVKRCTSMQTLKDHYAWLKQFSLQKLVRLVRACACYIDTLSKEIWDNQLGRLSRGLRVCYRQRAYEIWTQACGEKFITVLSDSKSFHERWVHAFSAEKYEAILATEGATAQALRETFIMA